jgi:hypothetical protein
VVLGKPAAKALGIISLVGNQTLGGDSGTEQRGRHADVSDVARRQRKRDRVGMVLESWRSGAGARGLGLSLTHDQASELLWQTNLCHPSPRPLSILSTSLSNSSEEIGFLKCSTPL